MSAVREAVKADASALQTASVTMEAHWQDNKDIEDSAVLADLVMASGLDPEKALLAADAAAYLRCVDELRLEYKQEGVTGIPTFVFGTERVEGCQPYEVLAAAALRAGTKYR
jgi:predicted DsbA family dithiol-disulfide isomerase